MPSERISEVSRGYQGEIRSINRDLMEKALHMRCLAYLSQAKAGLLTQTLFEIDRSKKELYGSYCRISEEQQIIKRQKAELEAANDELRSFSYAVSHDLRAPLTAIYGLTQFLLDDNASQLGQVARRHVERIVMAANRMSALIDGMLELSRLSQREMALADVDLSALAQTILREFMTCEPDRQVHCTVAPDLHATLDRNLACSLLQNLLGNAWKYTRHRPKATIEFGRTSTQERREFFVRDNGAGLDLASAHKLFVPFQRYHADSEFEGIGIGLATVKRILDRHGGRIRVDSSPGQGATFYFSV